MDISALSDWELGEVIHNRHASVMLMEVNGGQYSTDAGRQDVGAAQGRYDEVVAERDRRQKLEIG